MPKSKLFLVALDGSEWSERAAQWAVNLASGIGARVHFFAVIPWSGFTPMSVEEVAYRPLEKSDEERHAKADILEAALEKHKDSGVEMTSSYTWGNPVEKIHEEAKSQKAHMIFAGRRGRSRVLDMVLGSVSNALAHKAGVPIVLVP